MSLNDLWTVDHEVMQIPYTPSINPMDISLYLTFLNGTSTKATLKCFTWSHLLTIKAVGDIDRISNYVHEGTL